MNLLKVIPVAFEGITKSKNVKRHIDIVSDDVKVNQTELIYHVDLAIDAIYQNIIQETSKVDEPLVITCMN